MNIINSILKNKKTLLISTVCIFLLLVTFFSTNKNKDEGNIDEGYLYEEIDQKLTTEKDLLLPEPTTEAEKEFKKYNVLTFSETSFENNTLLTEVTNNSSEIIALPSFTLFSKDSNEYEYITIDENEIKPQQTITINRNDLNLGSFELLKYSYFVYIDGILTPVSIDLSGKAAYVGDQIDANEV